MTSSEAEVTGTAVDSIEGLVGDAEEFFGEYWARSAVVHRPLSGLAGLITAAEIWDEVDCGLLLHPYLRTFGDDGQSLAGRVDGSSVRDAFARGATVQLNNVEEWHRPTHALLAALSPGLPGVLRAVAFLSPPGTTPVITAHMDGAHVFVIQIEGEKDWTVGPLDDTTVGDPAFCSTPDIPPQGRLDVTLRPRDVLYVPHGCAHYALARSTDSLHLSVNVEEPSTRHLLNVYLAQFMTSPPYRCLRDTPGLDSAELVEQVRTGLASCLSTADPDQVAAATLDLFARTGGGAAGR